MNIKASDSYKLFNFTPILQTLEVMSVAVPPLTPSYIHSWYSYRRCLMRHCITARKFTGSIPDVITITFHWHVPPGHTTAQGSTQTQTEKTTRIYLLVGKGWQPYCLHVMIFLKSARFNLLENPRFSRSDLGLLYVLHEDLSTFMIIYRSVFLRMEMFQTDTGKMKTHN